METEIDRTWVSGDAPGMVRGGPGGHTTQGIYYTPKGERPKVAFIASHYDIDFSEHYLADLLAKRGFGFLGWNTRFRGAGQYFLLEQALVDIGVGVKYLREVAGVETVVIIGNSGGGSLMAAYQSQSVKPVLNSPWVLTPTKGLDELQGADLYISLNAHPGRPDVFTAWMDPAVTDENDPLSVDPDLDMFNPKNARPYSEDFISRYRQGQRDRNERITVWVESELERMTENNVTDRLFLVNRVWADLRCEDLTIEPTDRKRGCYRGDTKTANYSAVGVGRTSSLRTWLSMWSLRTSPCRVIETLPNVVLPALVIQSMGDEGVFPSDAEELFSRLGSSDKQKLMPPGDHYFLDTPNGRDDIADIIVDWVGQKL